MGTGAWQHRPVPPARVCDSSSCNATILLLRGGFVSCPSPRVTITSGDKPRCCRYQSASKQQDDLVMFWKIHDQHNHKRDHGHPYHRRRLFLDLHIYRPRLIHPIAMVGNTAQFIDTPLRFCSCNIASAINTTTANTMSISIITNNVTTALTMSLILFTSYVSQ